MQKNGILRLTTVALIAVLLTELMGSCSDEEVLTPQCERDFVLFEGYSRQCVLLEEPGLRVEIASVLDSRCPRNFICIMAGDLKVVFRCGLKRDTLTLYQSGLPDFPKSGIIMDQGHTYEITLLDATQTMRTLPKLVKFRVEEL